MCIAERVKRNWLALIFLVAVCNSSAQTTVINGVVKDAKTQLPLASVTVSIKNLRGGVTTDSLGYFSIRTTKPVNQLLFSIVGYKNQTVTVKQQVCIPCCRHRPGYARDRYSRSCRQWTARNIH